MLFNGLGRNLGNLSWLSEADTRSISAENPTGGKGMGALAEPEPDGPARELGRGWKCRPYVTVEPQTAVLLADIEGPGAIQSMWFGGSYAAFSSPFSGMPQVICPDGGVNKLNSRYGLYRWHVMDPIRFKQDLRVTMQVLGWRMSLEGKARYLALQDDIASTAFWYQLDPDAAFPSLPSFEYLEVI